MTLADKAYLQIDKRNRTATFELEIGLEPTDEVDKSYIMGPRGQFLRRIFELTPYSEDVFGEFDSDRRTGIYIDGGGGTRQLTLAFETGLEDVAWGDEQGQTGPDNVTESDASGADVHPVSRKDVFQYWIQNALTDSISAAARLQYGEWHNTEFTAEAGAFGQPMPVAILDSNLQIKTDDAETLQGTVTLAQMIILPDLELPGWVDRTVTTGPTVGIPDA